MKSKVSLIPVGSNPEPTIKHNRDQLLKQIKSGCKYLIKPNLFTTKTTDEGATTDPYLIFSIAKLLKENSASVKIGECPAMASYTRPDIVFEGLGIQKLCSKNEIECLALDRDKPVKVEVPDGVVLKEIWLPETVFKVDGIINMPKLKTHQLTTLTCAVKNLFGLQQGGSKAHHHRRVANDPEAFSQLLLDIYVAARPYITTNIVDAIVAMEGEGPSTGDPVKMDLLIVGEDACSVDYVAALVAGWEPMSVPTIRFASERGIGPSEINDIEITGASIKDIQRRLRKPVTSSELEQFHRIKMPITVIKEKCVRCGICKTVCPGSAITIGEYPMIDLEKCIQCFCCTELCPNGAIKAKRPDDQ